MECDYYDEGSAENLSQLQTKLFLHDHRHMYWLKRWLFVKPSKGMFAVEMLSSAAQFLASGDYDGSEFFVTWCSRLVDAINSKNDAEYLGKEIGGAMKQHVRIFHSLRRSTC